MPTTTETSNAFAATVHGRSPAGTDRSRAPASPDEASDRDTPPRRESPANLTLAVRLLLPVATFAISLASIEFTHYSNFVEMFWPSNAIILVALLRHDRSPGNIISLLLSGIAANFLASLVAGNTPALAAILAAANLIEIVTALTLIAAFRIGITDLISFKNMLLFIVTAGGVAPFASTFISAPAFGSAHGIPWHTVWRNWYPGHALGMIIVASFLISVTSSEWQAIRIRQRLGEAIAILAFIVAVAVYAAYFRYFIFVVAPVILFATVRFGLIGATVATFMTAVIASSFVVAGIGEPVLSVPELSGRLFALQVFLAIMTFWSLPTATLLTERDRLLGDLSCANSRLRVESDRKSHLVVGLRRHLSIAEEKERLRLSYELHDQAGQGLIAAILELNEIDSLIDGPARERLNLVRKRMEELGKTLHRIAWELRPPSIDELGLRKALASYIADWGEQCDTEVDFHCDDPNLDAVPGEIGTTVYRVVQEGLTNIVKHAQQPSDVSIVIRRVNATLQVIIEDNGCGFDVGTMTAKSGGYRGLGLDGMRERLILIGGTLDIESAIGTGTTIFARVALDGQRSAA
jgi:signal transduction histidine kinase